MESICWDFDEVEQGADLLQFKLLYHGQLHASTAANTRCREKHLIRKQLHRQLAQLWEHQQPFCRWKIQMVGKEGERRTVLEVMADQYARCGYRFVPIVQEGYSLNCELDILFLRRDGPGNIVTGGDIDNRIKTLFDALRMPGNCSEVSVFQSPDADENPFFVLLEDDSQIAKVTVSADRLLSPITGSENANDVHLVIGVKVNVMAVSRRLSNLEFLGS